MVRRIDEYLPVHDFADVHEIEVAAPPREVRARIARLDMGRSPIVRLLFAMRGIPRDCLRLADVDRMGFTVLANEEDELLFGLIGKFWTLRGGIRRTPEQEFKLFAEEGYAKAAWNFSITSLGPGVSSVRTETRIQCTDAASRRRFARYWRVVRPFSGAIRVRMLEALRVPAE